MKGTLLRACWSDQGNACPAVYKSLSGVLPPYEREARAKTSGKLACHGCILSGSQKVQLWQGRKIFYVLHSNEFSKHIIKSSPRDSPILSSPSGV